MNKIVCNIDIIIEEYSNYVYKIVSNIVSHNLTYQDKEDIVSETFYLLWKNQNKINTNLKSYIATIARNCSYKYLKNKNIDFEFQDDFLYEYEHNEIIDKSLEINLKLDKLNEKDNKIFELFYVYGYKIKEISSILNLNSNVVKVRLHRIRKKLKEEL